MFQHRFGHVARQCRRRRSFRATSGVISLDFAEHPLFAFFAAISGTHIRANTAGRRRAVPRCSEFRVARLNSLLSHPQFRIFSAPTPARRGRPKKIEREYAAAQISSPAPMISPNRFINARAYGTDQPIGIYRWPRLDSVLVAGPVCQTRRRPQHPPPFLSSHCAPAYLQATVR